jgi:putative transposase
MLSDLARGRAHACAQFCKFLSHQFLLHVEVGPSVGYTGGGQSQRTQLDDTFRAMFPGVPWQRCQFHLQHNAKGHVSRLDQRTPVARQIRGIFNASDATEAQRMLNGALKDWQLSHPQLATWAEKNLAEGFAVFDLPKAHRVRMRTTNGLERLNKELKRRTRVATLFPIPASCLRLISA